MTPLQKLLVEVSKRCPQGKLPEDYIVFDTETSGTDTYTDRVLQYGICFVYCKKASSCISQVIDRREVNIHPRAFEAHGITNERMQKEGVKSEDYVPGLIDLFNWWRSCNRMFVGHNLAAFDAKMLDREAKTCKCEFIFGDNEVVDTGMIVKASQIGMTFNEGETLRNFYTRVAGARAKVKWALTRYCYTEYKLEKYGITVDEAHDAGKDCLLTHYLLEELRKAGGIAKDSRN